MTNSERSGFYMLISSPLAQRVSSRGHLFAPNNDPSESIPAPEALAIHGGVMYCVPALGERCRRNRYSEGKSGVGSEPSTAQNSFWSSLWWRISYRRLIISSAVAWIWRIGGFFYRWFLPCRRRFHRRFLRRRFFSLNICKAD
jgi:hypothetical protein